MNNQYRYKYPNPSFSVDDYIHQNTKASNSLALNKFKQQTTIKGGRVYDCGSGEGRLFRHLSEADLVVASELDRKRFSHSVLKAKAITENDQELHDILDPLEKSARYYSLLSEVDQDEYHIGNFHLFNTCMTKVDLIKEYGLFDTIVSSHVFPHVPFNLVQETLTAFYTLLKPEKGILAVFITKTKGEKLTHLYSERKGDFVLKPITGQKFLELFYEGNVLPIRYYHFRLFQEILLNPFSPNLAELFAEEFSAIPELMPKFKVIDWLAYRCNHLNGFYEDYETIQKIIGIQNPVQLRDFCSSKFDEPTAQFIEAFSILLESSINRQEEWKMKFLQDMLILAQKID